MDTGDNLELRMRGDYINYITLNIELTGSGFDYDKYKMHFLRLGDILFSNITSSQISETFCPGTHFILY